MTTQDHTMPPDEAAFAVLAHKVESMHSDFSEIRSVLRELTSAINKLALVEERQTQAAQAQERAFVVLSKLEAKIDAIDARVKDLEIDEPLQKQTSNWVTSAVWGFAGIAAAFILNKILDGLK